MVGRPEHAVAKFLQREPLKQQSRPLLGRTAVLVFWNIIVAIHVLLGILQEMRCFVVRLVIVVFKLSLAGIKLFSFFIAAQILTSFGVPLFIYEAAVLILLNIRLGGRGRDVWG